MNVKENINFTRVAEAIDYIRENFKQQPRLDEIAGKVHLSPYHFQRLFTEWAGTSPKNFLQYISMEHAKKMLKEPGASLFDTAIDTGFSGSSRLHDLFIKIEGMTPGEFKNGGEHLRISYSFADSRFGNMLVASTAKGICYLAFTEDEELGLNALREQFPNAAYRQVRDPLHEKALLLFKHDWGEPDQLKLHLKGTPFQIKVWETLLKIPLGGLTTYGNIARHTDQPNASRAVGTAIGSNPVAFLIPCHRVIQSTGMFGGYRWGSTRKTAMIGWEAARINAEIKTG